MSKLEDKVDSPSTSTKLSLGPSEESNEAIICGPKPRLQLFYFRPNNVFWYSMCFFIVGSSMFVLAGGMFLWAVGNVTYDVYAVTGYLGFFGILCYQFGCWCGVMDSINLGRKEPGWTFNQYKWFGFDLHSWYWWGWGLFFFGTPFFIWSNLLALPGVMPADYDYLTNWVQWDLIYWTPLTIGGLFFVFGGFCGLIDGQEGKLWNPKVKDLTWWATLFYFVGSIGFTLNAVFGYFSYTGEGGFTCCQRYGTDFSYFWGSILFLVASYLLLIDTIYKDDLKEWCFKKGLV